MESAVIAHELRRKDGILIIIPEGPLESSDFDQLTQEVDEYIVENGALTGVMICAEAFPGWENFAALLSHMKFVRNIHQDISKVAAVTDSAFLTIMPQVIRHFVTAEVRHFSYDERDEALAWLRSELSRPD